MKKDVRLDQVSCILPRKEEKIISEVVYCDGEHVFFPVQPSTVAQWIADKNYINLKLAKRRSMELNHLRKGAPIPLGMHDTFLPIHLVEEMRQGYACYGFCNVANQTVEVLPVPEEKHHALLHLGNGTELLVDSVPRTLSAYLSMAIATHQRFVRDIMADGSAPMMPQDIASLPHLFYSFYPL